MKSVVLITCLLLCMGSSHGDDRLQEEYNSSPQLDYNSTKRAINSDNNFAQAACPNCEGCELVRLKETLTEEELENFQFPSATKASGSTTSERAAKVQSTFTNFAKLAIGISHLIPPPIGPRIRALHGIFTSMIALVSIGKSSLWEQIERKVEAKIENYLTYDHFKDLEPFWLHSKWITEKCPDDLTREDLMEIMKMKSAMFPQNNDHVSFTPQWVTTINAWLMFVAAVYLELTRQSKLPQCALMEEMVELRGDVVTALKSLQMKRWKSIRGHDYFGHTHFYARMQYRDEVTGKLFPSSFNTYVQDTESVIFKRIDDDTFRMIDPLRVRFNELLDVISDAMEGCSQTIEPIEADDSHVVTYPKDCYGESKGYGYDYPCLLPCEFYGWHSYWCPAHKIMLHSKYNGSGSGPSNGKIYGGANWERCDPVRSVSKWKRCFPGVEESSSAVFFKRPWGRFKKKAKKAKKVKKVKTNEKGNFLEGQ